MVGQNRYRSRLGQGRERDGTEAFQGGAKHGNIKPPRHCLYPLTSGVRVLLVRTCAPQLLPPCLHSSFLFLEGGKYKAGRVDEDGGGDWMKGATNSTVPPKPQCDTRAQSKLHGRKIFMKKYYCRRRRGLRKPIYLLSKVGLPCRACSVLGRSPTQPALGSAVKPPHY